RSVCDPIVLTGCPFFAGFMWFSAGRHQLSNIGLRSRDALRHTLARTPGFAASNPFPSSHLAFRLPINADVVCSDAFDFKPEGNIMRFRISQGLTRPLRLVAVALLSWALPGWAQGPAPETAPPLFPGGGLVSYSSNFTTRGLMLQPNLLTVRPTFAHEGNFNFTWGFHPNFDLTVLVPLVTNRFDAPFVSAGGTGLGDVMFLVKYRFYRQDSERGTTQASFTVGPKLPTGRTHLTDSSGKLLPPGLQPGSGSTDLFVAGNWTYTGLFNLRRLVVDGDFHSLLRSTGTQSTNLGDDVSSRFWLSYRPYEAKD